jgi:hypothetical protein
VDSARAVSHEQASGRGSQQEKGRETADPEQRDESETSVCSADSPAATSGTAKERERDHHDEHQQANDAIARRSQLIAGPRRTPSRAASQARAASAGKSRRKDLVEEVPDGRQAQDLPDLHRRLDDPVHDLASAAPASPTAAPEAVRPPARRR